jgi:hypothetical protein
VNLHAQCKCNCGQRAPPPGSFLVLCYVALH